MTLRIGGYAAILGGLLWFTVLAGNAINDGGIGCVLDRRRPPRAIVATLIALIGLSAFQARRYPGSSGPRSPSRPPVRSSRCSERSR